jgi:deoxyadenosine/deoxycytidine kinase
MWISIEATIGAGKTTLCRKLREHFLGSSIISIIEEPVQKWIDIGILQKFYDDQERWSYTFQSYTFLTRMEEIMSAEASLSDINIVERSIFSDRKIFAESLHSSGKMTDTEWEMYCQWWNWLSEECFRRIGKPSGYIYLRVDPQVAYDRMNKRNRSEENGVPFDYLEQNVEKHDAWLLNEPNVLVIDANEDFEYDNVKFQELVQKIANFVQALQVVPSR